MTGSVGSDVLLLDGIAADDAKYASTGQEVLTRANRHTGEIDGGVGLAIRCAARKLARTYRQTANLR